MVGRAPLNVHGLTPQKEALMEPKGKEEADCMQHCLSLAF